MVNGGPGDFSAPEEARPKGIAAMLGLDKCCDMFGLGGGRRGGQSQGAAMMARAEGGAGADDSWMGAVNGLLTNAMDLVGVAPGEKTTEQHAEELQAGGLFWRKQPNREPKTVWLALRVSDDGTEAFVEWRNPQLVLNRAVDKESVPLGNVRAARAVAPGDELFFPEGAVAAQSDGVASCVVLETNRGNFVFESANAEERDRWTVSLTHCIEHLVPKLYENAKRRMQDERRVREIEERKGTRDARRAEYAKAGMENTARIMAGMGGGGGS